MKGKKLSVYRAHLPRTLDLVAALLLAVISTSAFAREFRAADTVVRNFAPTSFAARVALIYEKAQLDPAAAGPIAYTCAVE
jgi:uncharacterized membrane protein